MCLGGQKICVTSFFEMTGPSSLNPWPVVQAPRGVKVVVFREEWKKASCYTQLTTPFPFIQLRAYSLLSHSGPMLL